jgi:hypothetical protein
MDGFADLDIIPAASNDIELVEERPAKRRRVLPARFRTADLTMYDKNLRDVLPQSLPILLSLNAHPETSESPVESETSSVLHHLIHLACSVAIMPNIFHLTILKQRPVCLCSQTLSPAWKTPQIQARQP